jgi:hypothetical protein
MISFQYLKQKAKHNRELAFVEVCLIKESKTNHKLRQYFYYAQLPVILSKLNLSNSGKR